MNHVSFIGKNLTSLFSNNYLFIFFSGIGLVYFKITLFDKFKNNFNDIILFLTLIFLEIDRTIFHETYDILDPRARIFTIIGTL